MSCFLVVFAQVSSSSGKGRQKETCFCSAPSPGREGNFTGREGALITQTFPREPKHVRAVPPGGSFISAHPPLHPANPRPAESCLQGCFVAGLSPLPGRGAGHLASLLLSPSSSPSCKQEEAISGWQVCLAGGTWAGISRTGHQQPSFLKGTQPRPAFQAGLWLGCVSPFTCEEGEARGG